MMTTYRDDDIVNDSHDIGTNTQQENLSPPHQLLIQGIKGQSDSQQHILTQDIKHLVHTILSRCNYVCTHNHKIHIIVECEQYASVAYGDVT